MAGRELAVGLRDDPRGRPLVELQFGGLLGDFGDELNRTRAGSDDCDALAQEVAVVVPLGGMEAVAGEVTATFDVRKCGIRQLAACADQYVELMPLAGVGDKLPDVA